MVTLRSYWIWQIISFILPPNEYGCVHAWTTLGSGCAIDLLKMPILAKIIGPIEWGTTGSEIVFFQLVTLTPCLLWQIISFILPPNVYDCVYAWTTLGSEPAIDLQKMLILAKKKSSSQMKLILIWRVCIQAKFSHLGHRKSARTHWKANASKTSHFLVRILFQKHNCAIFRFENEQGEAVTVIGDRYRAMLNE